MQSFITGLITATFIILSVYSWQATHPHHQQLIAVWRTPKAAELADVYGLTPDDVAKPVMIFGH